VHSEDHDHLSNDDQVNDDKKELGKREKEIIYRGKIGALFKELNNLIPLYRKCNNSRLSVLEKAINYIQKLKSEFKQLKEENSRLRQENSRLDQIIRNQGVHSNVVIPSPCHSSHF
jgi:hypothetical protein